MDELEPEESEEEDDSIYALISIVAFTGIFLIGLGLKLDSYLALGIGIVSVPFAILITFLIKNRKT
jgi:hypothetical protein